MTRWTPDPTFYPSPRLAAKAPAETLAYVAAFAPKRDVPDSLAVVDVDPASPSYATIVGGVDMPNVGDELHHYGWNACSSCLCPNAPHPHTERRYLVVPGLRSSRIHIIDTKSDRRRPSIVRVIEPEELIEATGYTPAAHGALRARGHLRLGARRREGRDAGRRFPDGPRDVRRARPLGGRARAAASRLRRLVASRLRHAGHERMGHAQHHRERVGAGDSARRSIRTPAPFLGPAQAETSAGDRFRSRLSARVRASARRTIRPRPTASSIASSASRIYRRRFGAGIATATNGRSRR